MPAKVKLSKTQLEVLQRMANGWELGHYQTFRGGHTLQKGGLGKGGLTERVGSRTAYALYRGGYIYTVKPGFPARLLGLTNKGRQAVEAAAGAA